MQGRGVLLDLARHFGAGRTLIGHAELMQVLKAGGITVESGDMLVLRTGFAEKVVDMAGQPDPDALHGYGPAPAGTAAPTLQWITARGIVAPCAHKYAVDAYPARDSPGP